MLLGNFRANFFVFFQVVENQRAQESGMQQPANEFDALAPVDLNAFYRVGILETAPNVLERRDRTALQLRCESKPDSAAWEVLLQVWKNSIWLIIINPRKFGDSKLYVNFVCWFFSFFLFLFFLNLLD